MFDGCESLTSLDLSSFNTAKVIHFGGPAGMTDGGMFYNCSSLKSLDLSNFNTAEVTDMSFMFWECLSLTTTINIMSTNVTSYAEMFKNAATSSNAQITINYIAAASTLVDKMIASKSSNSNVVKGSQIS